MCFNLLDFKILLCWKWISFFHCVTSHLILTAKALTHDCFLVFIYLGHFFCFYSNDFPCYVFSLRKYTKQSFKICSFLYILLEGKFRRAKQLILWAERIFFYTVVIQKQAIVHITWKNWWTWEFSFSLNFYYQTN